MKNRERTEPMQAASWKDDDFQFMRLLAEMRAVCDFTPAQIDALSTSMDLSKERIDEMFDRADAAFEAHKAAERCQIGQDTYQTQKEPAMDYTVVLRFHECSFEHNDTYTAECTTSSVDEAVLDAQRQAYEEGRHGVHSIEMIFSGHTEYLSSSFDQDRFDLQFVEPGIPIESALQKIEAA